VDKKPLPVVRATPFPTGTPNALPVVPRERSVDLVSMPWTLARIEDDGRRPIIVSQRRHLHPIVGVTVEATGQAVTIALLAEHLTSTAHAHTQARIHSAHSVILDRPLGDRELRHAAVTYQANPVARPPQHET
jgi:hypothetical protein